MWFNLTILLIIAASSVTLAFDVTQGWKNTSARSLRFCAGTANVGMSYSNMDMSCQSQWFWKAKTSENIKANQDIRQNIFTLKLKMEC